jgi:hypothetical protein
MLDLELPFHPVTGLRAVGLLRNGAPVWPVLGAADDEVEIGDADPDATDDGDGDADLQGAETETDGDDQDGEEDKPLGAPGQKALQAEKDRRREADRRRREAVRQRDEALAELERLRKPAGDKAAKGSDGAAGSAAAPDLDAIRAEAQAAATAQVKAEVLKDRIGDRIEVLAAKRAQDPDVVRTLLMSGTEIADFLDGDKIDAEAIKEALDELLEAKPYLAVQAQGPAKRFQGSGDGGARKGPTGPSQLTENDLKRMSPEEIVAAQQQGRFDDLLGMPR